MVIRFFTGFIIIVFSFCFLFFIPQINQIKADSTAQYNPGTNTEDSSIGTVNWNQLDYDKTSDDTYATSQGNMNNGESTVYLKATNFGFSIPSGSTIDGITVNVEKKAGDTSFFDNAIRIVKNGTVGTTDRSYNNPWPIHDDTVAYGGVTDLWGETWTDTDINNANFGFAISVKKVDGDNNKKPLIDWVNITITYTLPDTTAPSIPGVPHATIGANLTSQDWSWTPSTDLDSGLSHYLWQVDEGPNGTTITPNVTTNLSEGVWKFHIKAVDNAGNQSTAQSALLSIFSSSVSQVTIDNSVPIVWIITPDGIPDPIIDLAPITVANGDLLEANINTDLYLKTILSVANVTVHIPTGAVIKGSSGLWTNNIIIPPIAVTTTVPAPSGFTSKVALAIKVGHDNAPLVITKGVRIFMEGQFGKKVGYISGDIFTEITTICTDDSQATGDALATGSDCKIESGQDLIIWTKHFSKFVTYDLIVSTTDIPSKSSNGPLLAPSCNNSVTNSKPDLFEIRVNNKTAALYFTPPSGPYNSFYIAYSRKPDSWEYGTEFNQQYSGGVLKQTINLLKPKTKYYFKIRAGNDCATGAWGNTMAITTSSTNQNKTFYKNIFTAVAQKIKNKISTDKEEAIVAPISIPVPIKHKFCILWWCF